MLLKNFIVKKVLKTLLRKFRCKKIINFRR